MNLHQLGLFVAVAEHGSYTRAAEALYISQPSVSARIRDLETSLGQQLFEQVGRRIYLTDAGQELLERAQTILQQLAEARRALDEIQGLQRGSLRVVATTTVGSYVLPALLGRFHRVYPGIALALDVTNWSRAVELLRRGRMDLAVLGPIVAMELRHSAAIKQGVAAGLGVALLSRKALGLHLATGTLVTLDVEGLPMRREWHIVHLRGRRLPRAAAAFKEMLLEGRRQATGDRRQSERVVG